MFQYSWLVVFFYLYYYGLPPIIRQLTIKLYIKLSHLINEIDKGLLLALDIFPEYYTNVKDNIDIKNDAIEDKSNNNQKYEDKYLEDIRKLNKEFIFTEEEEHLREEKKLTFYNTTVNKYIEEIKEVDSKLTILNEKIEMINKPSENNEAYKEEEEIQNSDNDTVSIEEDLDDAEFIKLIKEERIDNINEEINDLQIHKKIFQNLLDSKENHEKIMEKSIEIANDFILSKHLERLQNCFVLETTPHGNVLMIYDNSKSSFKYHSDNTIPYRYLEPVARKYIKQFNCRPLYVDMEEELKIAEEKWEKERIEKEEKEQEEKRRKEEAVINNKQPLDEKKNVFAKFKTYNKEAGSGRVNTGAPPKNSIPNNKLTKEQENEKILLKEKANRYTYEGKLANFSFLKKVERKVVDKKYGLSFADFKKMYKYKNL